MTAARFLKHVWPFSTLCMRGLSKIINQTLSIKLFDSIALTLTHSCQRSLSNRNQSTDFQKKSMDWFLRNRGLRHESTVHGSTVALLYTKTIAFSCYFLADTINSTILRKSKDHFHDH